MTTLNNEQLNKIIKDAGLSRTVYAFVMPQTQQVIDRIVGNDGSVARAEFHEMYTEAWTQKQDVMHQDFFETWRCWVKDVVTLGDQLAFEYPTAGASEPIRDAIYQYAIQARTEGFEPKIHVFAGEYEGYSSYADAAGVKVVVHDRNHWQDNLESIDEHAQFYLSHPSAIDGSVWPDYDHFMRTLQEIQPEAKIMLDLTYVGCVARDYHIRADYKNIDKIFFSLSKPFGLYYHRCGGMLSRDENKGLFGNKWFKNLLSLKIGTEMMREYDVHALPRFYRNVQDAACAAASSAIGLEVKPSDVFLLGKAQIPKAPKPLHKYLQRHPRHGFARVCLTPSMAHIVDTKISTEVRVRAHEKLEM